MATEAERLPPASVGSTSGRGTAVPGDGVDLEVVERDLHELLRRYALALRYAADMPWLGRSAAESSRRPRFGSRFWTRVYVETHVREQLLAIAECLRLRLFASSAEEAARLKALCDELEAHSAPLFRWRRLTGLVSRVPPVAAAIPVLSAFAARPFSDGVSRDALVDALLVLTATALLLWIVVVWPSVRLGFRVKRVIFSGGVEVRGAPDNDRTKGSNVLPDNVWLGFTAPDYDDEERFDRVKPLPFPDESVYVAENRVYRALGRRKPAEVPLDLLFRFWPYILTAYSVFFFWGLVDAIGTGSDYTVGEWVAYAIAGAVALMPIGVVLRGVSIYRKRPH